MPAPAWRKGGELVLAFSLFRQVVIIEHNEARGPGRLRKLGQKLRVKRLGPTNPSRHRTEVQILVPTPPPSLRGLTGHQRSSPRACVSANAGADSRPRQDGPSDHSTAMRSARKPRIHGSLSAYADTTRAGPR